MHISRMRPGEISGYLDLERRFKMSESYFGRFLRNRLHHGINMREHTIEAHRDIIDMAASRLISPREVAHVDEGKRAATRGIALGSTILSSLPDAPHWPEVLDEAVSNPTTNQDIMQLHEQADNYLSARHRPVLHKIVRTYLHEAVPRSYSVEAHGIAWHSIALVLMSEDEGRFLRYADNEIVTGLETMLRDPGNAN